MSLSCKDRWCFKGGVGAVGLCLALSSATFALGAQSAVDIRGVVTSAAAEPRPTARRRLAWEVRKRTSIETQLKPSTVRLDDPSIFKTPFLYWSGDQAFQPLSDAEISGLRRFVRFGGFVLIDNASPDSSGFDRSVRRALERAFSELPLRKLPLTHTIFRSYYLLDRPVGRVEGPVRLEAIEQDGRAAVVYARQDLGGAWARDSLGNWVHPVEPGGDRQRELAVRLGVNLVMYALCLDYKDDQVHAPFIMRRRGGEP